MITYLIIRGGRIVGQVQSDRPPGGKLAFGVTVCEDTPANRAKHLGTPSVPPRTQAAAAVAAILDGLRQQGDATLELRGVVARALANINTLIDLDKQAALDAFDALVPSLPTELQAQAPGLRNLLAAI